MFLSLKLIQLVLIIQLRRINEILGEAVKIRCERCGVESSEDPCVLCKRENGVIGETRLRNALKLLQDKYSDRKHGFSLGEAHNAIPFNFKFNSKILDKLYNFDILEKKTVQNSVRYEFTGRTLDSNYNIKPPVKDIKKRFERPEKQCKPVKYDDEIIREALILHDDGNNIPEIKTLLDKTYGVIIGDAIIQGWIDDFNNGLLLISCLEVEIKSKELVELDDGDNVENEDSDKINPRECPLCGGKKKSNMEICIECKEREFRNLFEVKIKPSFKEFDELSTKMIRNSIKKPEHYRQKFCQFLVDNKFIKVRKDGNSNYYTLPDKTIAEDPEPEIEEDKSDDIPKNRSILKTNNTEITDPQKIKVESRIDERKQLLAAENITKLPPSIQLISNLLPSLILATIITIEPGNNILDAGFVEQKTLLDLYEILPNQLKSIVKLHIDPESPIQKISIPLEG